AAFPRRGPAGTARVPHSCPKRAPDRIGGFRMIVRPGVTQPPETPGFGVPKRAQASRRIRSVRPVTPDVAGSSPGAPVFAWTSAAGAAHGVFHLLERLVDREARRPLTGR